MQKLIAKSGSAFPEHNEKGWVHEDTSCTQTDVCWSGSISEGHSPLHDWSFWNFQAGDSCRKVKKCKKCGKEVFQNSEEIHHNWLGGQNTCARCGAAKPLHSNSTSTECCDEGECHMGCTP